MTPWPLWAVLRKIDFELQRLLHDDDFTRGLRVASLIVLVTAVLESEPWPDEAVPPRRPTIRDP